MRMSARAEAKIREILQEEAEMIAQETMFLPSAGFSTAGATRTIPARRCVSSSAPALSGCSLMRTRSF